MSSDKAITWNTKMIGASVAGIIGGYIVTRYYPQKYWLPWLLIIEGMISVSFVAGYFVFGD